jgi:hypothetical protein
MTFQDDPESHPFPPTWRTVIGVAAEAETPVGQLAVEFVEDEVRE